MNVDTEELVDIPMIAEATGNKTTAIHNWIKRHEDFPKPVWTSSVGDRPTRLYLRYQVDAWIKYHYRKAK